ncbi:aldehyde dehydrogenase family protein [Spelaeicoccus albus]|uniref:Aldehyde dehydrogenase n=1 Tax=Spelaeicoccus albus TaxID=1280376 RepID=A0A7Z0IIU0_9MICO|nr:aldehyde dehydrogenase family protein [Spelaeicoccus albus]NYI68853.1 aldehyde dehydrogenase (NAD+) [Spelaeicoccus albus]
MDTSAQSSIADAVDDARRAFAESRSKPVRWRLAQLDALETMLTHQTADFEAALQHDLAKNPTESWLTEIGFVVGEIAHTKKHLRSWLAPRRTRVPASLQPGTATVLREPLGVVLVIAPWNYPIQLALGPLVGALAAGNTAVVKPSELAPATAAAIAKYLPAYLDEDAVRVVQGGPEETSELLTHRFDHIFYTGNGRVGRLVMEAAAKHLTPVTLELGGKSPVFIDESVDLPAAADRIAWGKFLNAGQTCVAPDYVLGTARTLEKLAPLLAVSIQRMFGRDPSTSADYGRIVSDKHFHRLSAFVPVGTPGGPAGFGEPDQRTRYLPPTVLPRTAPDAAVMREEIFGPVLPLVEVDGPHQAIAMINAGDKPLSLYVFSNDRSVRKTFTYGTSSGGLGFNVPVAHLMVPDLPFGGVGGSGMGRYHGEYSVDTFSHQKAIFSKPLLPDTLAAVYPPFSRVKDVLIRRVIAPMRRAKGG